MRRSPASGRAWAALVSSTLVSLTLAATPALAGSIGFTITSSVETSGGLAVKLEITNTGDEAAYSVTPVVEFGKVRRAGQTRAKVLPRGKTSWDLPLDESRPSTGNYAVLVRIRYEDANAYPFEVLASAPFDVGTRRRRQVTGSLSMPHVAGKTSAAGNLIFTIPESRGSTYNVKVALPRGLKATRTEYTIEAPPNRRVRLPVQVRNTGLLPGTAVNVFAMVTSNSEDTPQTDVVRGTVRIVAPRSVLTKNSLFALLAALVPYLLALEVIAGVGRRRYAGADREGRVERLAVVLLACTASGFLLYHYPWDVILTATTTAGGDMASLYYPTKLLAEEILPQGQVTGWTMGQYAGFPVFHFYSTLPFVIIVLLGKLIPMQIAFKLVTLAGPTLLPLAAAYMFRALGYRHGAGSIAALSTLPFLLQQGNSMWGGNIPSVLAGEFCHSLGITLSLVYLGVLHRIFEGKGSWPVAALLLTTIGLSHTFAFFATVWYSIFFLWPRRDSTKLAPPVLATFIVTALLLCFWAVPLPSRLVFTSEWSMIWRIKDWKEMLPEPLWPAAWLAGSNLLLMLARFKPYRRDREGLLVFIFAGALLLYFLVPAIGFPDIRFIPIGQLFIGLLAADLVYWLGGLFRYRTAFAACIVLAGLGMAQDNLGYVPSWLKWNYSGYEGKGTWKLFKDINDHIRGDVNDPRVVFEHSQAHNRFGSSRAFENLALFSGRSTLEGVFHQASPNSPFIFYLQSEASERGSGPFPQYTYTRLDPDRALPHLRMFNVSDLVVVSDKAKKAYDEHPAFEKTFSSGQYAVFNVAGGDGGYVVAAENEPVLYVGHDWKLAFYRWYKHYDLLDVPMVPDHMIPEELARDFALRTDSITRLPREPYDGECEISSHLEQYRISFDTTCPGRPHIVKVSYFPRWKTADGSPIYPVSPAFMLVIPEQSHFELYYGRTAVDWIGLLITVAGVLLLVGCATSRRRAAAFEVATARPFMPLLALFERHYITISLVLFAAAIAGGATTRYSLQASDRAYKAAQAAYKARDFDEAIRRLEAWTAEDKDTFKQATSLYQLGVSYSEIGAHAAAITTHERLRFNFKNVDYGAGTIFHLARNYEKLDELERAREYARLLEKEHGETNWLKRLGRENPALF